MEELLSIAQYVDRYRLGARWRLWHDHQTVDEAGRLVGYLNLDQIGRTLAPVLLPRRKFEVLKQLPPRVENDPRGAERRLFAPALYVQPGT